MLLQNITMLCYVGIYPISHYSNKKYCKTTWTDFYKAKLYLRKNRHNEQKVSNEDTLSSLLQNYHPVQKLHL